MFIHPLKKRIISLVVQVILYVLQAHASQVSAKGSCLTGKFFFAHGRNIVDNHALRGHVIANVTVTEPIHCFRACQLDCRCISFNCQHGVIQDNCQLNEENRYTDSGALEFLEGWQYYDLVMDFGVKGNEPVECQNGCCGSHRCLRGGTCHEICDVIGKRFTCECGAYATGKFCETAICLTPDWIRYQNSCFKKSTDKLNWFDAQQSCASMSSNLTSIHSEEESDFLFKNVSSESSPIWIGLYNLNTADHSYEWVDGTSLSFTKWNDGEPNNSGPSGENCTEITSSGGWNDLDCSVHNLTYICGRKVNP